MLKPIFSNTKFILSLILFDRFPNVLQSKGGWYSVQTGRRDGLVSLAKNVNLPGSSISVVNSAAIFNSKGISTEDMVYLLGT